MHYTELGYQEYSEYLEGKEWSELHQYFYKKCGLYRCGVCGERRRLVLHKRTYEYLTLRKLKRHYLFIEPLVNRWLKRHFVWLCKTHNHEVHFYDDGSRVPLTYKTLFERERVVYKRHHSFWRLVRNLRPSDILRAIGRFLSTYSV